MMMRFMESFLRSDRRAHVHTSRCQVEIRLSIELLRYSAIERDFVPQSTNLHDLCVGLQHAGVEHDRAGIARSGDIAGSSRTAHEDCQAGDQRATWGAHGLTGPPEHVDVADG